MPQAPVSASPSSLVKGFILTQRTDCRSPRTIEYYEGTLNRFQWYAKRQNWPDDAHLITEWYIREFLAYVSSDINRWGVKGNGSEPSRKKATYSTFESPMARSFLYLSSPLQAHLIPNRQALTSFILLSRTN